MVARLEARLVEAPDDVEGWLMLGRSRTVLGDTQGATDAFRRARNLAPDDPRGVGGLAESLTAMAGGAVTLEAQGLFVRLAEIEPRDPRSGFYLGWPISRRARISRPWTVGAGCSPTAPPTRRGGRR